MKLEQRSLKSKEKFADSLMAVANAVLAAALIGVFVFPLTAFVSSVFSGAESFAPLSILSRMTWPNVGIFGIVYMVPIIVGVYARDKAMDLYDEVRGATSSTATGKSSTV